MRRSSVKGRSAKSRGKPEITADKSARKATGRFLRGGTFGLSSDGWLGDNLPHPFFRGR